MNILPTPTHIQPFYWVFIDKSPRLFHSYDIKENTPLGVVCITPARALGSTRRRFECRSQERGPGAVQLKEELLDLCRNRLGGFEEAKFLEERWLTEV